MAADTAETQRKPVPMRASPAETTRLVPIRSTTLGARTAAVAIDSATGIVRTPASNGP